LSTFDAIKLSCKDFLVSSGIDTSKEAVIISSVAEGRVILLSPMAEELLDNRCKEDGVYLYQDLFVVPPQSYPNWSTEKSEYLNLVRMKSGFSRFLKILEKVVAIKGQNYLVTIINEPIEDGFVNVDEITDESNFSKIVSAVNDISNRISLSTGNQFFENLTQGICSELKMRWAGVGFLEGENSKFINHGQNGCSAVKETVIFSFSESYKR
jgi:hypothetical protein